MRLHVLDDGIRVSENSKTGLSVNVAIEGSCRPTRACLSACYAKRGPISFSNAVAVQEANLRLFNELARADHAAVRMEARRIAAACDLAGRDWIRWNGAGDLVPGSVRVINEMAATRPDILQWVVTRKPDMATRLADLRAIRMLLSFDHTTPVKTGERLRAIRPLYTKAKVRFAYMRMNEDDTPPPWADIVFNRHVGANRWAWAHRRVCPTSLPSTTDHHDACDTCRRCFK